MALLRPKAQTHTSLGGWVGECKSCSLDSLQQSILVNHVNHQKNFSQKFKGKIFWIPLLSFYLNLVFVFELKRSCTKEINRMIVLD